MNRKEFLYELKKNLKYLKRSNVEEIINKYSKMETNDLDPVEEANKIYKDKNINIKIPEKIKLYNAINIIINKIKTRDKTIITDITLFFLSSIIIVILIKTPFIYFREMILNLFNLLFKNELSYVLWNLFIEIIYSVISIIILIKNIKNKALKLKNVK